MTAGLTAATASLLGLGIFFTSGKFMHLVHEHEWEPQAQASNSSTGDDRFWVDLVTACGRDPACAGSRLVERADWRSVARRALASPNRDRRERTVEVLVASGRPESLDLLFGAAVSERDLLLRLEEARALAKAGDRRGLGIAVELLSDGIPALVRKDAHQFLVERGGRDFGFDPLAPPGANREAIARWQQWARSM